MQTCRSSSVPRRRACGDQRQDRPGPRGQRLRMGAAGRPRPTRARRQSPAAGQRLGSRPGASTATPPRARTPRPAPPPPAAGAKAQTGARGGGQAVRFAGRAGQVMHRHRGTCTRPAGAASARAIIGLGRGPSARFTSGAGRVKRADRRPARLWPGARQPLAAEGLAAHHRADLVAVDIGVAHPDPLHHRCTRSSMRVCRPKVSP
jgi:hypothetical protein